MQTDARREAKRQREWCLRDRGGRQHTQHDVLWALTSRAALVAAGCGVVVWMLIEWLA